MILIFVNKQVKIQLKGKILKDLKQITQDSTLTINFKNLFGGSFSMILKSIPLIIHLFRLGTLICHCAKLDPSISNANVQALKYARMWRNVPQYV